MMDTLTIRLALAGYATDGCAWAKMLDTGLAAGRCRGCTSKRMLIAANVLELLGRNTGDDLGSSAVVLFLNRPDAFVAGEGVPEPDKDAIRVVNRLSCLVLCYTYRPPE